MLSMFTRGHFFQTNPSQQLTFEAAGAQSNTIQEVAAPATESLGGKLEIKQQGTLNAR